jgi:hypothetical protein
MNAFTPQTVIIKGPKPPHHLHHHAVQLGEVRVDDGIRFAMDGDFLEKVHKRLGKVTIQDLRGIRLYGKYHKNRQ